MIIIPLQAIPNQSLTIQLDNNNWDIDVRSCDTNPQTAGTAIVAFSFTLNGTVIISGQRGITNWPLIAYEYLQNGNFFMITENDDYPDYTQFGITQYLIYASQAELDAL
jgi:hypothetical protein